MGGGQGKKYPDKSNKIYIYIYICIEQKSPFFSRSKDLNFLNIHFILETAKIARIFHVL